MNFSNIRRIEGIVLKLEAACLLVPFIIALIYGETEGLAYLGTSAFAYLVGAALTRNIKPNENIVLREGFTAVALCWILMSLVGALPMAICGDIPSYVDALFETVSGFTTTGASVVADVESLSHATLIWRSFTHLLGGMGVFVLLLAVLPTTSGKNMNFMKAESPGPSVSKLVPRLRDTAKILYMIYLALTAAQFIALLIAGMPVFDSLCTALGTAGTGGFGIKNDSFASYSVPIQLITGIFMVLFGVNFNAYFFLLGKNKKEAFKIEEVKWYFAIIFIAIVSITINILPMTSGVGDAMHKAGFQVASIITTTGFASTDFDLWPQFSKTILIILMFIGACAGSTGGGMKVSRIIIACKSVKNEIYSFVHPQGIHRTKMDGKILDRQTIHDVKAYITLYFLIFALSIFVVSANGLDFETTFTAVAATYNNIGPGFGLVGATCNYGGLSVLTKITLMLDMLTGRLELYPMLLLFAPSVWRKD